MRVKRLSVPAGTLRTCVYSPFVGSPESTANSMPFLSASSVHFRSANDNISGAFSFAIAGRVLRARRDRQMDATAAWFIRHYRQMLDESTLNPLRRHS